MSETKAEGWLVEHQNDSPEELLLALVQLIAEAKQAGIDEQVKVVNYRPSYDNGFRAGAREQQERIELLANALADCAYMFKWCESRYGGLLASAKEWIK